MTWELAPESTYRREIARLVRRVRAADRYPARPTFALLLAAALEDSGYWQIGGGFTIDPDPANRRVRLKTFDRPHGHPPADRWHFDGPAMGERRHLAAGRRSQPDRALNERNRADLTCLLANMIENDLPALLLLKQGLEEGRYYQHGHHFAVVLDRTGFPVLHVATRDRLVERDDPDHPGETRPVYETSVALRYGAINFDLADPAGEGRAAHSGLGWSLGLR